MNSVKAMQVVYIRIFLAKTSEGNTTSFQKLFSAKKKSIYDTCLQISVANLSIKSRRGDLNG